MGTQKPQPAIRLPLPRGLFRLLMRAPIAVYRLGLGRLLGNRFVLIEHTGRSSGLTRRTVVEVVDRDPQRGTIVVAAAWGARSQWFRNIQASPAVTIQIAGRRHAAMAAVLTPDLALTHLRAYAQRNPWAFRQLGSLLFGKGFDPSEPSMTRFAAAIPFVQFTPTTER